MFEDELHEMTLLRRHDDGSEEWLCEECGRHMILKCGEQIERTVKSPGNEWVRHYGGQFGIAMTASLSSGEPDATTVDDEGPVLH